MARYVLLEFADNAEANAFVLKQMDKTIAGAARRIVGYFAKPEKFCQCPIPDTKLTTETVLGARYGWRVHARCRRPRKAIGQSPRNLLDPLGDPVRLRTAFITLAGTWAGKYQGGPLQNFPITVIEEQRIMQMRQEYGKKTTRKI